MTSIVDLEKRIRLLEEMIETFFEVMAGTSTEILSRPVLSTTSGIASDDAVRCLRLEQLAAQCLAERDRHVITRKGFGWGCWSMDGQLIGTGTSAEQARADAVRSGYSGENGWIVAAISVTDYQS